MDLRDAFLNLALALVRERLGQVNMALLVPLPREEFDLLVKEGGLLLEKYREILKAMRR